MSRAPVFSGGNLHSCSASIRPAPGGRGADQRGGDGNGGCVIEPRKLAVPAWDLPVSAKLLPATNQGHTDNATHRNS